MENKIIRGEEFACGGFINYEVTLGECNGNSTETIVKLSSEIFTESEEVKEIEIKVFGTIEREALSSVFKKISEQLINT
jgi:hypothetical protein